VNISARGRLIKPKTLGQKKYVDSIRKNLITFGIGPAGTGKTYLAVALAAFCLRNREVERIVLTRPAVEAGEKLGFLPGDLQEKIDPYLRPLYDALADMFGYDQFQKLIARNIIEVAPLAYMRGRTLEESFIILDEAQNTTREQMKMFLTRMGNHSRVVVNGDITQIDLADRKTSGLTEAQKVLADVHGVDIVSFTDEDVVRHDMVGRIIRAYDRFYKNE
jgi:phosphate starvation-inducible PhoH-like protein